MVDGDLKGINILLLFLPGAIFPLTFLLKWLTFKLAIENISKISVWRMILGAFLESATPLLMLIIMILLIIPFLDIVLRIDFLKKMRFVEAAFCLFFLNWGVNHIVFSSVISKTYPNYMLLVIALAAIATVPFPMAWEAIGYFIFK